jgi:hypothetical protein
LLCHPQLDMESRTTKDTMLNVLANPLHAE